MRCIPQDLQITVLAYTEHSYRVMGVKSTRVEST